MALITVKDVAAMTTLAESTLFDWRAKGKGPRSFKLNGRVVYDRQDVLDWIEQQQAATTRGDASRDLPFGGVETPHRHHRTEPQKRIEGES